MWWTAAVLLLGMTAAWALGLGSGFEALAQMPKVRFAPVVLSSYWWPEWVAQEKGFFRDELIEVELLLVPSNSKAVLALSTNSVDLSAPTLDATILAALKGAPMKIVGGIAPKPMYDLIARPSHRRVADLRGTTLGIAQPRAGSTLLLQEMLGANRLQYPRDYSMLEVGDMLARVAAVKRGGVSAALVTEPATFKALEEGLVVLDRVSSYLPDYQLNAFTVNTAWATARPQLVVKFLKGVIRGTRWLYDGANKEEAARILTRYTRVEPKYAALSYDSAFREHRALSPDASVNMAGMRKVVELMVKRGSLARAVDPAAFIDDSYRQQALEALR